MRSKAEIERVRAIFISTGDDPPALNTAVRDAFAWVLGLISAEELIDEYLVAGQDYHCFTCPAEIWMQECLTTVRSATTGPEGAEQLAVTSAGQEAGAVMGVPVISGEWTGTAVTELVEVIPSLVAAYGVVLGGVVVVTGWQSLQGRGPRGRRRGVVVPRVGVIERDAHGGGDGGGGLR